VNFKIINSLIRIVLLHEAHNQPTSFLSKVKKSYMVFNAVMYIIWATLIIAIMSTTGTTRLYLHIAEAIYSSALYLIGSSVFCVVGTKLYLYLRRFSVKSQLSKNMSRKIGILAVFCTIIFAIRGILIIISIITVEEISTFVISVVYYAVCELMPNTAMMVMLTPYTNFAHTTSEEEYLNT